MIALDIKQQSSTDISPLSLSPKNENPTLSFASLLNAVKVPQTDEQELPATFLSLAPGEDEKETKKSTKSDILSLLKNQKSEESKEIDTFVELNPKLTASMSVNELKTLIVKAKNYIKSQITQSEGFKKQEIAALPKTLKGLARVAKKIGIDISKITLEKVQQTPQIEAAQKSLLQPLKKTKVTMNITDTKELTSQTEVKKQVATDAAFDDLEALESSRFTQEKQRLKTERTSSKARAVFGNVHEIEKNQQTLKIEKTATVQNLDESVHKVPKRSALSDKQENTASTHNIKEAEILPKETPLFKAQTKSKITTQELVEAKTIRHEPIKKKQKTEQTLELLLRGEKTSHKVNSQTNLTADFSVATAKVIAPAAETKPVKTLETLLKGSESKNTEAEHKTEMAPILKAESFEVKLHEAKQMVKYLSHDVKNAIDEYKSPFTRLKVQLNPQKLGEIDLTIVQRGKNLHINLSSNNVAINTLAMNANDLKVQLSNNGINNATLNFNNNSQSSDGSFGSQTQQQHQQQRERAQSEYTYAHTQESGEEILSSLEIVVPHYA